MAERGARTTTAGRRVGWARGDAEEPATPGRVRASVGVRTAISRRGAVAGLAGAVGLAAAGLSAVWGRDGVAAGFADRVVAGVRDAVGLVALEPTPRTSAAAAACLPSAGRVDLARFACGPAANLAAAAGVGFAVAGRAAAWARSAAAADGLGPPVFGAGDVARSAGAARAVGEGAAGFVACRGGVLAGARLAWALAGGAGDFGPFGSPSRVPSTTMGAPQWRHLIRVRLPRTFSSGTAY
jgi:hypothetical protein